MYDSYCDCFANGEFCRKTCYCQNCKNNIKFEEERAFAIKVRSTGKSALSTSILAVDVP